MNTLSKISIYGLSIALPRITVLILSVTLAYKLDEYQMSRWSIAVSLSSLFAGFIGLGLSGAILRWAAYDQIKMPDLITWFHNFMHLTVVFVITGLSILCYFFWSYLSGEVLKLNPFLFYLLMFGLCEAYSRFCSAVIRLEKKPETLLKFRVFQSIFCLFVTLTLNKFQLSEPFAVFASSYLLATIPMYTYMMKYRTKVHEQDCPSAKQNCPSAKDVLLFSLPATFQEITWWLKSAVLTIMVASLGDDTLISAFFFSMLIVVPFGVLYSAIDQTYEADYYKALANNSCIEGISSKYIQSFVATSSIILLLMIAIPIVSTNYHFPYKDIFKVVAPIALFGMLSHGAFVIWVKAIFYNRRTDLLFYGSAVIIGLTLSICHQIIGKYGYIVAAISSASMFFFIALFVLVTSRILHFSLINVKLPLYTLTVGMLILWFQFN